MEREKNYTTLGQSHCCSFKCWWTSENILITSDVENLMDRKISKVQIQDKSDFLVVDEFAALRISMDKKEFNEINDNLEKNYFDGTILPNVHY